MTLQERKCVPCRGGVEPMQGEQLQKYMDQVVNWELVDNKKIRKKFVCSNFKNALDFSNEVGRLAENEDHHPDILIHNYKEVTIDIWTHKIGGLHDNDFILAAKIDHIEEAPKTFSKLFE